MIAFIAKFENVSSFRTNQWAKNEFQINAGVCGMSFFKKNNQCSKFPCDSTHLI